MRAMVLNEYKKLDLQDFPSPECGPLDVIVAVEACGICGSDIHGYDGSTGRRIPPLIMGHEAAGIISKIGAEVTSFGVGDRVTFDSMVFCGKCHFCLRGQRNLCDNRRVLGVSCGEYRQHGAFAELIRVPQQIVYKIPETVSFRQAAMIEPVSVAVHAANVTPVTLGDTAVVVGAGMIGLLVVQTLKLKGASQVIAVDLDNEKLKTAKLLGADVGLNPKECDVAAKVKELTGGRGADICAEVVGAAPTIKTAIDCVRKGGTVTLVGNLSPEVTLPLQSVVTREVRLQGTCGCNGEYPECIELLSRGLINVEPLISATATLEEGPAWFEKLYKGAPGLMKVLIEPSRKG
jgi:L-iditol 2-dehydrogenase